jgi:hypothetical protein
MWINTREQRIPGQRKRVPHSRRDRCKLGPLYTGNRFLQSAEVEIPDCLVGRWPLWDNTHFILTPQDLRRLDEGRLDENLLQTAGGRKQSWRRPLRRLDRAIIDRQCSLPVEDSCGGLAIPPSMEIGAQAGKSLVSGYSVWVSSCHPGGGLLLSTARISRCKWISPPANTVIANGKT